MWEITTFVLNALLFVMLGLQLPSILDALQGEPTGTLIWWAVIVSLTVIVARIVWVFPATYIPRWLSTRIRERDPSPPWQYPAAISWMGLRGAVSLAAALSVPAVTNSGAPFPDRELVIYLAFSVIIATLVFQGLSLPAVIRLLGLEDDGLDEKEEAKARIKAAKAALARLEELDGRGLGERRHGRADARRVRVPDAALRRALRPGATTARSSCARRATSGCGSSSSRPSGSPSSTCGATGRSATR